MLTLGFVALYSSIASFAPLLGGITIPEFSPVRSPMNPILSVVLHPPPDELVPPAQAPNTSDAAAASMRTRPNRAPDTDKLPCPTNRRSEGAPDTGARLGQEDIPDDPFLPGGPTTLCPHRDGHKRVLTRKDER